MTGARDPAGRSRSRAPRLAAAIVLTAMAGWVDAVGYLQFAGLFVSFMSGNSTTLSVEAVGGRWPEAAQPILAIAAFVLGSFLGTLLADLAGRWRMPAVLLAEALLVAAAAAAPDPAPAIAALAAAMGAQNAALRHVGGASVGLTYVTGALAKLGQALAGMVRGRTRRWDLATHGALWLALALGAVGGAVAHAGFGHRALFVPPAVLGAAGLAVALRLLFARGGKSRER